MAAMRYIEFIIKASEYRDKRFSQRMAENTKHFRWKIVLWNIIKMVESGLGCPANVQRRSDMRTRPIEYFRNLLPISHFFKRHLFNRSTRYNHPVIIRIFHGVEVLVKLTHVFNGRILGCMAFDFHQIHFHLQRRITQQTDQIRFGRYLKRHQI